MFGRSRCSGETVRIVCVGGGPAGLYFAPLMKVQDPGHDITVFERSTAGSTEGWGVVFWNDVLANLYACDPVTAQEIEQAAPVWQKELVDVDGEQIMHTGGRGYSIRRQHLLNILAERAQGLGVHIEFKQEMTSGCSKFRTKAPPCASSANTRGRWPWPSTAGARWQGDGNPAPFSP